MLVRVEMLIKVVVSVVSEEAVVVDTEIELML